MSERWLSAVGQLFGWHVEGRAGDAIARRLKAAAESAKIDLDQLAGRALAGEPSAKKRLAELGTVGETYFFREIDALFAAVKALAVAGGPVQAWSAGCSTGEEPYTIAFLLDTHVGSGRFSVLGTDLDLRSLKKAAAARYGAWSVRAEAPPLRKGLLKVENDEVEVPPEIRAAVRFTSLNLLDPLYPVGGGEGFDLIVCRNVLTYFRPDSALAVLDRFAARLSRRGFLVVGPLDTVNLPASLSRAPGMPEGVLALKVAAAPVHAPVRTPSPAPRVTPERTPAIPAAPVESVAAQTIRSGMLALERGDMREAEAIFREALAQKDLPLAYLGLALCRSDLGDRDQARAHAARAQSLVQGLADAARIEGGDLTAGMLRRMAREISEAIR